MKHALAIQMSGYSLLTISWVCAASQCACVHYVKSQNLGLNDVVYGCSFDLAYLGCPWCNRMCHGTISFLVLQKEGTAQKMKSRCSLLVA